MMNHLVKRWQIENILILLFFGATFLVLFLTMLNAQKQEMLDIYTNEMAEKESVTFFTEESESLKLKEMSEQIDESFLLLKRGVDSKGNIHAVFNKGLEWFLPVKEGRSFERKDYFQHKKVAVIGENYEDVLKKDGSNYIKCAGEYFEVIGILNLPVETDFNKEAFINLDALSELNLIETKTSYVLNGREQTNKIFGEIKEINKPFSISSVQTTSKGTGRISSVSSTPIYILLIVGILGIQTLLSLFWIHKKERFVAVHQLIGHSTYVIFKKLFFRYLKLFLIGGTIGGLCYLYLDPQFALIRDSKYLSCLGMSCFLYALYNLCLLVIVLYIISNKETLKVLKES